MLVVFRSMKGLPLDQLMEIYIQSNTEGEHEQEDGRLARNEAALMDYLRYELFPEGACFLWQEQGRAVSALRCEPYRDGVLLAGLETLPEARGKGYATKLVMGTLERLRSEAVEKIYVHIHRDNAPSLAVHRRCGFVRLKSGALLLDGSYSPAYDTFLMDYNHNPL